MRLVLLLMLLRGGAAAAPLPYDVSPTAAKFLEENGTDFASYRPSFRSAEEVPPEFHTMTDVFKTSGAVDDVFQRFIKLTPETTWAGEAAFDLLYNPAQDAVYDRGAKVFPTLGAGQVFLLTLRIFPGCNIPVAFQFVKVDERAHEVQFSYLENNKSRGVQIIRFAQSGKEVVITHISRYQSGSAWRDENLYPHFHHKLLKGFYRRVLPQVGKAGSL